MNKNKSGVTIELMSDVFDSDTEFIPIVSDEDEQNVSEFEVPDILPILPLRNTVLFPGVIIPISIGREKSLTLIRQLQKSKGIFGAVSQKDIQVEEPGFEDLFEIGTVAKIIKVLEMPDNSTSVIIQGKKRFQLNSIISTEPYHMGNVTALNDENPEKNDREFEAIVGSIKDLSLRVIKASSNVPPESYNFV